MVRSFAESRSLSGRPVPMRLIGPSRNRGKCQSVLAVSSTVRDRPPRRVRPECYFRVGICATTLGQRHPAGDPVIWWNGLERIFTAVDDLNCQELLHAGSPLLDPRMFPRQLLLA